MERHKTFFVGKNSSMISKLLGEPLILEKKIGLKNDQGYVKSTIFITFPM